MITDNEQLFRVDESALHRFINGINDHLKRHDEQIAELQKLLRDVPSRNDLNQIRDDMDRKMNQMKDNMTQKIEDSNTNLNDKINRLKTDTDEKISNLSDGFDRKVNKLSEDTNNKISDLEKELEKLKKHISDLQKPSDTNNIDPNEFKEAIEDIKKLSDLANENREFIQTIATSYALVNKTQAPLGPNLQKTLYATSEFISRNIKRLSDSLKALQNNDSSPTFVNNEIDLSGLNFAGSEIPADFAEKPKLPPIHKFDDVPDAVQYLYNSVPKLQGYLNALHDKVSSINADDNKNNSEPFDPSIFDNIIKTVRKALNDMAAELEELKKGKNNKGLTRADVMRMIREFLQDEDDYDGFDTSVGYVKCIACGRETRQVVGAMTEDQAFRTLGAPSNSVALFPLIGGDKSIGQMFANSDQVDKNALESPRSKRQKRFNSRKFKPHPPS